MLCAMKTECFGLVCMQSRNMLAEMRYGFNASLLIRLQSVIVLCLKIHKE